jgi:phosphohistidine phosphatase SixA
LELGEGTPADQLSYLNSLDWLHYVDDRQLSLLVGDIHAPLVHRAAAKLAGPGTLPEQMKKALGQLTWDDPEQAEKLLAIMTIVQSKEPGAGAPARVR